MDIWILIYGYWHFKPFPSTFYPVFLRLRISRVCHSSWRSWYISLTLDLTRHVGIPSNVWVKLAESCWNSWCFFWYVPMGDLSFRLPNLYTGGARFVALSERNKSAVWWLSYALPLQITCEVFFFFLNHKWLWFTLELQCFWHHNAFGFRSWIWRTKRKSLGQREHNDNGYSPTEEPAVGRKLCIIMYHNLYNIPLVVLKHQSVVVLKADCKNWATLS